MSAAATAPGLLARPAGIDGVGLCTALGLDARRTWREMAAGTLRYRETEVLSLSTEPVRAARLSLLPEDASRQGRMHALALTALHEILPTLGRSPTKGWPLVLALPAAAAVDVQALIHALQAAAQSETCRLRCKPGWVFHGRAGGLQALALALRLLAEEQEECVLVGSADSLCDPESLRHLARSNRALGRSNPDGMLPGEGAGFLLVSSLDRRRADRPPLAVLLGAALSREPSPIAACEPSNADGLTAALRALREHPITGERRADRLVHGQSGESFWAKELSRAYLRNAALCPEPFRPFSIAAALGDTGAAAGVIAPAIAVQQLNERGQISGQISGRIRRAPQRALAYCCSDDGQVGACVLEEVS